MMLRILFSGKEWDAVSQVFISVAFLKWKKFTLVQFAIMQLVLFNLLQNCFISV